MTFTVLDMIGFRNTGLVLKNTFGKSAGGQGYDERGDLNKDDAVNAADFTLLRNNFGTRGASPNCP